MEETMRMFEAAREPLKTFLWIAGKWRRPAEVCGLDARYIDLEGRANLGLPIGEHEATSWPRRLRLAIGISQSPSN